MLGVVGSSLKMVKFEPSTHNTSQHIATGWPRTRNMLRSTMLRWHVAIVWPDFGVYNITTPLLFEYP